MLGTSEALPSACGDLVFTIQDRTEPPRAGPVAGTADHQGKPGSTRRRRLVMHALCPARASLAARSLRPQPNSPLSEKHSRITTRYTADSSVDLG